MTKHGLSKSRTYRIWSGMLTRCANPRTKAYKNYGARGIYVCGSWQRFENFFADMGECPPRQSIERINNDGPYAPENCKWADDAEQSNNRRDSIRLTFDGQTMTIAQWARHLDIPRTTLQRRWREKRPVEQILSKKHMPHGFAGGEPPIAAIRRALTHCKHGHELSGENLYVTPKGRACKTCVLINKRKFNAKAKAARHARGLKRINSRWA